MGYAVVALVLGGVIGLVSGGRLRNLGEHRLAGWPLLLGGIVLQALSNVPQGNAAVALLLASYAALSAFAALNMRVFGMAFVVLGLALNLLVIGTNKGMPVRAQAAIDAGVADDLDSLYGIRLQSKHHFERPSDRLMLLADVIPVRPLQEVLSIGDIVMSVGLAVVVSTLMRKEPTHPQPESTHSLPSER